MLAVAITFERRSGAFNRLLLAPLPLSLVILAKTAGAILFGVANAFVPMLFALFATDLSGVRWGPLVAGVLFTAVTSAFLGLFIAASVREVFEAQTLSNFFRFPMIFLCGLFVALKDLPWYVRPLSFILPPTYGVDLVRSAIAGDGAMPLAVSLTVLAGMTALLFVRLWGAGQEAVDPVALRGASWSEQRAVAARPGATRRGTPRHGRGGVSGCCDPTYLVSGRSSVDGAEVLLWRRQANGRGGEGADGTMLSELNKAIDYIESHLTDELSLDEISQHAGVSGYHLRKVFSYVAGLPLSEYIKNRRLSEASRDLLRGERVTDVALKYGYESLDGFTRAFKKWTGFRPEVSKTRASPSSTSAHAREEWPWSSGLWRSRRSTWWE